MTSVEKQNILESLQPKVIGDMIFPEQRFLPIIYMANTLVMEYATTGRLKTQGQHLLKVNNTKSTYLPADYLPTILLSMINN